MNIAVEQESQQENEGVERTPHRRNPFQLASELLGWDRIRQLAPHWPIPGVDQPSPTFVVRETEGAYVFCAELPDVRAEEITIRRLGNRLTAITDKARGSACWKAMPLGGATSGCASAASRARSTLPEKIDEDPHSCPNSRIAR